MAADMSAAQSTWVTQFRADCQTSVDALTALDADRTKAAALGGVDTFVSGAFAGNNADLDSAAIDAALASLLKLRAILYDPSTGLPSADLLAILRVARK